ncbi:MAG TPA: branched-chain amino acid ABC transporter permease [Planctomycetota bacterium]|nr:branched-chain amino acid ABC transporter permease [Planctomycetota bacterium]
MTTALSQRGQELAPTPIVAAPRFLAPLAAGVVLAILLELVLPSPQTNLKSKIFLDIGINVILAVSLNMVNGFTGQFSMGHAGFMAVGGYAAATITYYGSFALWGNPDTHGVSGNALFFLACLAAGLVAAALGYLVGLPSLRLRGDYLAIVTLGFGEIVRVLVQLTQPVLVTPERVHEVGFPGVLGYLGGALGFSGQYGIPTYTNIFWAYAFVTVTLVSAYRMKRSTWGRAFLAVRENEIAAEAMGVHTTKVKVRAFVVAAFFAGIAGSLYGHETGALNPATLGFMRSFDIIIMVVLGGMGSVSGSVVAAVILTILPEALRPVADYRMVVYALSLIVMMILRPQGIFGIREVWELGPFKRFFVEKR